MIYSIPEIPDPLDQGDVIDDCPVTSVIEHVIARVDQSKFAVDLHRVLVLTQTCDFANAKAKWVVVASVFAAQQMIDTGLVKASDVKGSIRAGRSFGLYFLPAHAETGIGEMIVDLRRLHSIRVDILESARCSARSNARLHAC